MLLKLFIGRRIFSCQKSVLESFPFPIINPGSIRYQLAEYCKMVDAKLEAVPSVDIDPEGIFKYVLIKVYGKEKSDGTEPSKLIVRGYSRAQWHSDIYDEVSSSIQGLGLDTECLGGGRIEHRPDSKKLKVYGYSQGFGKADHAETKDILKTKYSDYNIEISDDGY